MTQSVLTATELLSLSPLIVISLGLLTLLTLIPFNRNGLLSYRIGLATLGATLLSLLFIADLLPQAATPLLLIDGYGLFFSGLLLVTGILLLPFCHHYWEQQEQVRDEFYLLYLLSMLGAMVLVWSNHFAALFIGLELLSLPLVVMVGYPFYGQYSPSLEAAIKYLVLSAAASATLLFGMALIYAQYGTLEFVSLTEALESGQTGHPLVVKAGVMLILAALAFKLSLAPFHLWTPDVYQGAPLPATTLLATVSKGAIFALLLRFYLTGEIFMTASMTWAIALLAVVSMLAGNLLALLQNSLKRLLAYSSIGHFGYLLLALLAIRHSAGSEMAVEAVAYYLVAYLLSVLAAFAVLMHLSNEDECIHGPTLEDLHGFFWRHPTQAGILTLALLSLAGIPLTVGFIGKFYVFAAAVEQSLWGLLITAVVASGIGLFYYLRVIFVMTYAPDRYDLEDRSEHRRTHWVLALIALMTLWLGVAPASLMDLIRQLALPV